MDGHTQMKLFKWKSELIDLQLTGKRTRELMASLSRRILSGRRSDDGEDSAIFVLYEMLRLSLMNADYISMKWQ